MLQSSPNLHRRLLRIQTIAHHISLLADRQVQPCRESCLVRPCKLRPLVKAISRSTRHDVVTQGADQEVPVRLQGQMVYSISVQPRQRRIQSEKRITRKLRGSISTTPLQHQQISSVRSQRVLTIPRLQQIRNLMQRQRMRSRWGRMTQMRRKIMVLW